MPASELAHNTYALDDAWPGQAALLREELMHASSPFEMFSILERALLQRLNQPQMEPAIAFAIRHLARPQMRVATIADRLGWSSRRLIDRFRERTGLSPKAFHRVRRFQHVLTSLRPETLLQEENWAALADRCGYYDQAHFIHDFRAFAGMTPSEYVLAATPHLNHVPLT